MEFLAVPDSEEGQRVAEAIGSRNDVRTLPHDSGRPWLIGQWSDAEMVLVEAGKHRVALLGSTSVSTAALERRVAALPGPAALDAIARELPGSVHLLASFDGRMQARGSASAARRVFYTRCRGTTVAASRPRPLAELAGTSLNMSVLPLLLMTIIPLSIDELGLWDGVKALDPADRLDVEPDGTTRTARWWSLPEPTVPLAEGAARVRDALTESVRVRTGAGRTVSCDLSGGMDSSAVAFLAAQNPASLVTTRTEGADPSHGDTVWGAQAAAGLPTATHLVYGYDDLPRDFTPTDYSGTDLDAPLSWFRTAASGLVRSRACADQGSTVHLVGYGGDELFWNHPLYLRTLIGRHPVAGLRAVRATRSLFRWPLGATVRGLADRRSYARWLADTAAGLNGDELRPSDVDLGWGQSGRVPPWITPEATERVRATLGEVVDAGPQPLAPQPGQHESLRAIRETGDALRWMSRFWSRVGPELESPFLDDRVVEAALSLRIKDRAQPGTYKPVLAAAMRGTVPDHILGRPTKAEFSANVFDGLRANRDSLAALCEDMQLARAGLVDAGTLRAHLTGPHVRPGTLSPLLNTLSCEIWLRALARQTAAPIAR